MTNRYQIFPKAQIDLEEIWLYGVNRWGLKQAEHYLVALEQSFQFITENPKLCRMRDEFDPPVRIHHHGRHLIVYLLQNDHVLIIRILHDSMDIEQYL